MRKISSQPVPDGTDVHLSKHSVSEKEVGMRVDLFLSMLVPQYSRSFIQKSIEAGCVAINNEVITKNGAVVALHDVVSLRVPLTVQKSEKTAADVEHLGIVLVHDEDDFAVIYKPAGVLVHAPHKENRELSLVDWLLVHIQSIKLVGQEDRPGIVHRLDKETSGLLLVPKNPQAHAIFSRMFKNRTIKKTYYAVVKGHPAQERTFEKPIGRHPTIRTKMTVLPGGRDATTMYKVVEYFKDTAVVEVNLITGRTHQIRVHFAHAGHPLLGDTTYGVSSPYIKRQALHAGMLAFEYEGRSYRFVQPLPEDMVLLIKALRA